jgi:hypothetical protein
VTTNVKNKKRNMARKGGNPNIQKHGFKKGDPNINRKGRPKQLPVLKMLMAELLGHTDEGNMSDSEIAEVVKALIRTAKSTSNPGQVAAAKEIMERAFGKVKQEIEQTGKQEITWNETKTYKK